MPFLFEADPAAPGVARARGRGYSADVTSAGVTVTLHDARASETVGLAFAGGRAAQVSPEDPQATRVNYLIGQREKWRTRIPTFARVRLRHVYPGIDAVFYGREGALEYDMVVAPGASPDAIRLTFDGVNSLALAGDDLVLRAGSRTLTQRRVNAYQTIGERRVPVSSHYEVHGGEVSIAVGAYDRTRELILDPTFAYSTFFGATGPDEVMDIATTGGSKLYVVGYSQNADFPVSSLSAHKPASEGYDAYVAKFAIDGSVEWLTFFGGSNQDLAMSVAVGSADEAYVGGITMSADFPITPNTLYPFTPTDGDTDLFVLRLSSDGTTILDATCLGSGQDTGEPSVAAIKTDMSGNVFITGQTASPNFPVTIAQSRGTALPGPTNSDAYVARLSGDLSKIQWSRLLAGSKWDNARAMTVDQYGGVYVAGSTTSDDFPVLNALFPQKFGPGDQNGANGHDGFLTYLWTDGSIVFSTYLGGTGEDDMNAVVQGQYGRVYVGGTTTSDGLEQYVAKPSPTYDTSGIIFEIVPNGTSMVDSRYIPASGNTGVNALAVGRDWSIWVAGNTDGAGWQFADPYPVQPLQTAAGGGTDIFLQKWGPLNYLHYSTLVGGSASENVRAIVSDPLLGDVYFGGSSLSTDYPVRNAVQQWKHGTAGSDADGVIGRLACLVVERNPVPLQPASGGPGETDSWVEDGCLLNGVSTADWLHITGTTTGGDVTFTTDPNPTTSARTANIVMTGRTSVPVTQAAGTGSGGSTSGVDEIVLNATDVNVIAGRWQRVPDPLHGSVMSEPDQGDAKITAPLATPANYFEVTFNADANKPYHLWIHGLAQNDSYLNDSAWVQFSDSVDSSGNAVWRVGTTDGTFVSLEPCSGCGEQGWGWRDNQYGGGLGPNVMFATSGSHTMRIQQREDGFTIGQVTLSAVKYLTSAPGAARNDSTVLPSTTTTATTHDEIYLWASADSHSVNGTWSFLNDPTAAGSSSLHNPDNGAPKLTAPLASPANYFDITFTADAGKPYHLWLRMKADNDSWTNDSVWVQFSGSVDASGNATNRIGTTSGQWVSLEECSGCGEQAWGWQDNMYGSPGDLGPNIYFAQSGTQTIRIQVREDGEAVDQIVLSAGRYLTTAPGTAKNDTTILPRTLQ